MCRQPGPVLRGVPAASALLVQRTFVDPAPNFFRTRDITKADFEGALGKEVVVEVSRARDHSRSGLIRQLTLPGGKVVSACPQNC